MTRNKNTTKRAKATGCAAIVPGDVFPETRRCGKPVVMVGERFHYNSGIGCCAEHAGRVTS